MWNLFKLSEKEQVVVDEVNTSKLMKIEDYDRKIKEECAQEMTRIGHLSDEDVLRNGTRDLYQAEILKRLFIKLDRIEEGLAAKKFEEK